jgi:LCP family protein required for cell wall assembly
MQTPEAAERGRSAFAAAFFSALQPGLGHAYLGAWGRALLWATPSILFYAFAAGVIRSMGVSAFAIQFAAPSWEIGALIGLGLDVAYRGAAAVSAYRYARAVGTRGRRSTAASASGVGLIAVVLVLLMSHVAVGQVIYLAYSTGSKINEGDNEPVSSALPSGFESQLPGTIPPTPTQEPGATPGPTDTAQPTPTQGEPWDGVKRLNILLIGADSGRYDYAGYLTDTMIVMSIDPPTGRVAMISLPRDTVGVPFPRDWAAYNAYGGAYACPTCKINTLYTIARARPDLFPGTDRQRGYNALKGALGELYGITIQNYVAVDLRGFRDVINTLGGVVVDVQVPVYDSKYPLDDGRGATKLYVPPGIQYMDGAEALAYGRARHATSDFDRAARQQRIIASVRAQTDLSRLLSPGVITELFQEVKESVRTDIPQEDFPKFLGLAQKVDFDRRMSLVLTPPTYSTVCYPCPPSGLYELKANVPTIRKAVQNIFDTDPAVEARRQKIAGEAAVVHVLNGTTETNFKTTKVAEAMATYGIDATVPPINGGVADNQDYTDTVITVYNGAEEDIPTTIDALEKMFKVTVVTADDPAQTATVVVVVGKSTAVPPPGD